MALTKIFNPLVFVFLSKKRGGREGEEEREREREREKRGRQGQADPGRSKFERVKGPENQSLMVLVSMALKSICYGFYVYLG